MAVGAFAVVVFIVRFAAVNSEVYEFADDFVAKDARIASLTGRQDERALRWTKGFSMSYGDNSGEAALTVRVAGERGAFDVPLSLKKSQGRWGVVYAKAINEKGQAVVIVE